MPICSNDKKHEKGSAEEKSEGGILSGCFCNAESVQRLWVQTLDHILMINQLFTKKPCKIIHHDPANSQRLADEEIQSFNEQTPK